LTDFRRRYRQHDGLRLLIAVCRELQRVSGEREFLLSCRTAGNLLGVNHVTAARYLFLLAQTASSKRSNEATGCDPLRLSGRLMRQETKPAPFDAGRCFLTSQSIWERRRQAMAISPKPLMATSAKVDGSGTG
jgi:hypothetical protein